MLLWGTFLLRFTFRLSFQINMENSLGSMVEAPEAQTRRSAGDQFNTVASVYCMQLHDSTRCQLSFGCDGIHF